MALMKCPECGNEVSSNASNCPKCGNPISSTGNTSHSTVEFTSKKLKVHNLLASFTLILGFIILFSGGTEGTSATIAIIIIFIGIVWLIVTRIRTWWHHK